MIPLWGVSPFRNSMRQDKLFHTAEFHEILMQIFVCFNNADWEAKPGCTVPTDRQRLFLYLDGTICFGLLFCFNQNSFVAQRFMVGSLLDDLQRAETEISCPHNYF